LEKTDWKETKKECEVNEQGELIPKRITLEAQTKKKKYFGFESKDFFDFVIKFIVLGASLFTALNYFNTKSQQEKAELEKLKAIEMEKVNETKRYISQLKKDSVDRPVGADLQSVLVTKLQLLLPVKSYWPVGKHHNLFNHRIKASIIPC
jgi:hypothetical protein